MWLRLLSRLEMSPEEIMERGRVEARSMLYYWEIDSLGISQRKLAKRLKLAQPLLSQKVRRGIIW